jgi:hypothetical protein
MRKLVGKRACFQNRAKKPRVGLTCVAGFRLRAFATLTVLTLASCSGTSLRPYSEVALPSTDYTRSIDPFANAKQACGLRSLNFAGPNPEMFAGSQLSVQWETARQLTGYCRLLGPIPSGEINITFEGTPSVITSITVQSGKFSHVDRDYGVDQFFLGKGEDRPEPWRYSPSALIWAGLGGLFSQMYPLPRDAPAAFFAKACKAPYLIGADKRDPTIEVNAAASDVVAVVKDQMMPVLDSSPPKGPRNPPATYFGFHNSNGTFGGLAGYKGMTYYSAFINEVGEPPLLASIPMKTHWRDTLSPCDERGVTVTQAPKGSNADKVLGIATAHFASIRQDNGTWFGSSLRDGTKDRYGKQLYVCASTNLNDQQAPNAWKLEWGTTEQNGRYDADFMNQALLDKTKKVTAMSTYVRIRGSRSMASLSCNTTVFD